MQSQHHPHALAAASLFGLTIPNQTATHAPPPLPQPDPGQLLLLTGPSGSGKTTALRALAKSTHDTTINLANIRLRPVPAVAHFSKLSAPNAMRTLAAAGLADARAFLRTPSQLSQGQRWRLTLAIALDRAARTPRQPLIIADEFAALLDPITAAGAARLFRRAITRANIAAAIATPRTDITSALAPNTITTLSLTGAHATVKQIPRKNSLPLAFTTGTKADYFALAPHHYLPGTPATIDHILVAHARNTLAAALTVSRPTLNSAHRHRAWPGRYSTTNKATNARRVNRELRCITRVIVDPRFAGQGIATRLTAHYLKDPKTPCTEAIAAMGTVCPFFQRAGMTAYHHPPSARNARLLDAINHIGISREQLASPPDIARTLRNKKSRCFLERELTLWARSSRSTQRRAQDPLQALITLAHHRLTENPVAYAHTI